MRALIVAHGQPSDPAPAERELAALSAQVAAHLPGWRIGSATLAAPGALEAAVAGGPGLVYPLFMADGWFTATHLPHRLSQAGGEGWRVLAPFGTDPAVQDLAVALAREAAGQGARALILAAHGSGRSPAPAQVAQFVAARIARETPLRRVEAAFIEQAPRLRDVREVQGDAVCLPFFAAAGGHVEDDLPAELARAGFSGRLLPPLGLDPRVPGLIAAGLIATALPRG